MSKIPAQSGNVATQPAEGEAGAPRNDQVALLRAKLGLSQAEMAEHLGCSGGHVSLMERTGTMPKQRSAVLRMMEMAAEAGLDLAGPEVDRVRSEASRKLVAGVINKKRSRRFRVEVESEPKPVAGTGDAAHAANRLVESICSGSTREAIRAVADLAESSMTIRTAAATMLREKAQATK